MTDRNLSSFEVSWLFVQEYYTIMNRSPEKLYQFYNKDSYYCNGSEGESSKIYHGQSEINKRIKDLDYEDCKVLVSNVDCQVSSEDGIIIQVLGEMSNKGSSSHKFAQTFFLAKQPNGYFVLNDIIRFLKEDIENEYEDFDTTGIANNETINTSNASTAAAATTTTNPSMDNFAGTAVENQLASTTEVMSEDIIEKMATINVTSSATSTTTNNVAASAIAAVNEKIVENTPSTMTEEKKMDTMKTEAAAVVDNKKIEENKTQKKDMADQTKSTNNSTTMSKTSSSTRMTSNSSSKSTTTTPSSNTPSSNLKNTPTTAANTTTNTTRTSSAAEYTEPATEETKISAAAASSIKRVSSTNQPKSFATVTASNTNSHSTTTHIKEISKLESKSNSSSSNNGNNKLQQNNRNNNQKNNIVEKEVFLKDVTDNISKEKIIEAFSKFGEVKKVEINNSRRNGYLEFSTAEAARNAIAQKSIKVDGHKILAEEKHRRKPFGNNYGRNRNDYRDRDSNRGYQNGKSGSFNMNRGKSLRAK